MNDLFPTHYDPGQLRLRCERMGLSCAYSASQTAWARLWGWVRRLWA